MYVNSSSLCATAASGAIDHLVSSSHVSVPMSHSAGAHGLAPCSMKGLDSGDFDKSDIKRRLHSSLIIYIHLISSSWTHPVPLFCKGFWLWFALESSPGEETLMTDLWCPTWIKSIAFFQLLSKVSQACGRPPHTRSKLCFNIKLLWNAMALLRQSWQVAAAHGCEISLEWNKSCWSSLCCIWESAVKFTAI